MTHSSTHAASFDFLPSGGMMGALVRRHDWTKTPLGAPSSWPQPLKTLVSVMLGSNQPMFVVWGPERTLVYNDPYAEILADKHPAALGRPLLDVWDEIRAEVLPIVEQAYRGEPVQMDDIAFVMHRKGYAEETHFSFFYSPVRDETGAVAGLFCACNEITAQVQAERRAAAERERQRLMLQQMPGFAALLSGPEHRFEYVNDAYIEIAGDRDFIGRTVREVFPELADQGFYELLDRVYTTGEPFATRAMPIRLAREDGERFIDFLYHPIRDDAGAITGIFVGGYDATEQVRAQSQLRAERDRLAAVLDGMGEAFGLLGPDFRILKLNAEALRLDGRPREAIVGRTHWDVHPGSEDSEIGRLYKKAMAERVPVSLEHRYRWPDGRETWLDMRAFPVADGLAVFYRDITDRKAAEAALSESEARFRLLAQSIEEVFYLSDTEARRVVYVSPAYERLWGQPAAELFTDIAAFTRPIHPDDRAMVVAALAGQAQGEATEVEYRILRPDGEVRWIQDRSYPVQEIGRRLAAGVAEDVTARRTAELRLRELNATLEAQVAERTAERDRVWRLSRDLLVVVGADGVFRAVNPAWTTVLGHEPHEVVGRSFRAFIWPEDAEATQAALDAAARHDDLTSFENRYRHKDGSCRWISWHTSAEGDLVYAYGRDVTADKQRQAELAQVQEALRQAQKIEAIGQLTGGVAHDFNNLLQAISGGLQMLERGGDPERQRRLTAGMRQAVERGAALTRQLLAFARRQPLKPEPVDLVRHIGGMRDLLDRSLRGDVQVETRLALGLWPVEVDVGELELALLNLCVNARDAMPEGGTITIAAENVPSLDDGELRGDFVRLSVVDRGVGMTPEVLARVFEPFFTTKDIGRGSGLGLPQVHGFARQSGGAVRIESTPGKGTAVSVLLPRIAEQPTAADRSPIDDRASGTRPAFAGSVLLVEDDEEVAALTTEMLKSLGYEVTRAASAAAALGALADRRPVDLVFSDIMMPGGMNGVELAREIRTRRPGLPVLLTSGYAAAARREADAQGILVLPKPYRLEALAAAIQRVMRDAAPAAAPSWP